MRVARAGRLPAQRLLPGSVPSAYGTLTVRSLLDTREHCLNEFNFPDPYSQVRAQAGAGAGRPAQQAGWQPPDLALGVGCTWSSTC